MADKDEAALIAAMMGEDAPAPKRKGGRPPFAAPQTYEEALGRLPPQHGQFVRSRLAGATIEEAYRSAYPSANVSTCRSNGRRLMNHLGVKAAIDLGAQTLGKELAQATLYDAVAADREIAEHIATSVKLGQMNAVASLIRERLKLHRLTDTKDATAQAGFSIVIHQADGSMTVVGAEDGKSA